MKWTNLEGARYGRYSGKYIIPYGFVSKPTPGYDVRQFWCSFPSWKKAIKDQISNMNKVFKEHDIPVILKSYRSVQKDLGLVWKEKNCDARFDNCFSDVITFSMSKTTCDSGLGRKPGHNIINLSSKCVTVILKLAVKIRDTVKIKRPTDINHEIMHAFGFWHEHQRPNRDKYLKVGKNIIRGMEKNFKRYNNDAEYPCAPYDIRLALIFSKSDQLVNNKLIN